MATGRLDRAARIAAGHICLTTFHLLSSSVIHPLRSAINPGHHSVTRGLSQGERELVADMIEVLTSTAETLRKLGNRLLRANNERR